MAGRPKGTLNATAKYIIPRDVTARYGNWTVIDGNARHPTKPGVYWKVQCDCGETALRNAFYMAKHPKRSKMCGKCRLRKDGPAAEKNLKRRIERAKVLLRANGWTVEYNADNK